MSEDSPARGRQSWLEIGPPSGAPPTRLMVFLHGAGSSPEAFVPVALAWQMKFPGACVAILHALRPGPGDSGMCWFETGGGATPAAARDAARAVIERIAALQSSLGLEANQTIVIGFSQGATVALEIARLDGPAAIIVGYAARLVSPIRSDERVRATVHLIHGALDTLVAVAHARRALRGLDAIGARVTLDITEDGGHWIGQDMIILGTTRAMQSVFRGRRPASQARTLH